MKKALDVAEYLENEFDLELSHQNKVDIEKIVTASDTVGEKKQCCVELPKNSFFLGMTCPKCNKPFRLF